MSNNLVIIQNSNAVTTSLAIADGVGNSHKTVIQLIRQNTSDLEEFGPLAFEMRKGEPLPQGGFAKATEYAILNEQQSTLLLTYMRNNDVVREFKKRLVKAFYEMREKPSANVFDPSKLSRLDVLKLAIESEEENQKLKLRISEDRPKVEFHDKVTASLDLLSVAEAAKVIGLGRNKLAAFLRREGWMTRHNEPYQAKINAGLMNVKLSAPWEHPTKGLQQSVTPMITGKGLAKLQSLLQEVTH